jgi:iron complex outermembrane receptor protein
MVTWFDIETENAKSATSSTYELDDGTYYYYTEADELRRGLETTIKGNFGQGTSYQLSWTHMLDNERTSDGVTTNYNGVSNPRNLYSLRLSHAWRAYRANLSVKRVDEWSDCSSAKGKAEAKSFGDYTRIDANIKRDFKWRDLLLTLSLYGRNLGDKHYATRYVTGYYYDRGRTIGTELTVRY